MGLINHPNFGDVQKYAYLIATVTDVDSDNDTVDFTGVGRCPDRSDIALFYHCSHEVAERTNGALEGAAAAFSVDDRVIVQCEIVSALNYSPVRVIGFEDQPKECEECEWISHFDNTEWEEHDQADWPGQFVIWTGTRWKSGNSEEDGHSGEWNMWIQAKGSWADELRPTKIRITTTDGLADEDFTLKDSNGFGQIIANSENFISGEEYPITFQEHDIATIEFGGMDNEDGPWYITNIEFCV